MAIPEQQTTVMEAISAAAHLGKLVVVKTKRVDDLSHAFLLAVMLEENEDGSKIYPLVDITNALNIDDYMDPVAALDLDEAKEKSE